MLRSVGISRMNERIAAICFLVASAGLHILSRAVIGSAEITSVVMRSSPFAIGERIVSGDPDRPVNSCVDLLFSRALAADHCDRFFFRQVDRRPILPDRDLNSSVPFPL